MELEEELRVVGNNLKSLEVSEEKVSNIFLKLIWKDIIYNFREKKNIFHYWFLIESK